MRSRAASYGSGGEITCLSLRVLLAPSGQIDFCGAASAREGRKAHAPDSDWSSEPQGATLQQRTLP